MKIFNKNSNISCSICNKDFSLDLPKTDGDRATSITLCGEEGFARYKERYDVKLVSYVSGEFSIVLPNQKYEDAFATLNGKYAVYQCDYNVFFVELK